MIKLTAPKLTPGNVAQLQRTNIWLAKMKSALEVKKTRLDELNTALDEAEARRAQLEKDAALDPDAALNLAGAEAQLGRLAPQIKELQQSITRDIENAVRQINLIRSSELRELLIGPLIEQISEPITKAILPFFDADWANQFARQIMQQSNPYRQLMFWLNRPIAFAEFESAKQAINVMADEIVKIIDGETLLEA